jgi:hypothetical protein
VELIRSLGKMARLMLPFDSKLTRHSGAQPDHSKSAGQSVSDKMGRSHDREVHGSGPASVVDKTKDALGLGHRHV